MKNFVFFFLIILVLGCSSTKEFSRQTSMRGINVDGLWVGYDNDDLQFVLYVEETANQLGLNVMGKLVIPMDYRKQDDQALIKFRNTKGEIYYLLAQVNDDNQMRMSITSEYVGDFMPIGQLGEKVYRLRKIEDSKVMVARLSLETQSVVLN